MHRPLLFIIASFFCCGFIKAQQAIKQRIILIGDAGEINAVQKAVIKDAVEHSLKDKTTVFFLGDNIYPYGMGLDDKKEIETNEAVLKSQYEAFRKAGVPVYFIPGNHDWDKSGKDGFKKIMKANAFIEKQLDSALQIVPKNGCPGPYEIKLSDDLVVIVIDSEWWLFPYDKHLKDSECDCKTLYEMVDKLEDLVEKNRKKVIIFADHHPFHSFGTHGGYYSIKPHLFPLTEVNKNLYLPLPVIGSLYPLLRKVLPPAEDLKNPLYKELKKSMENVLQQHPNVLLAGGHEHTLQLIQADSLLQVVSGAASKETHVKKNGSGSLYAKSAPGYVIADLMNDNSLQLSYYEYDKNVVKQSFTYTKPFVNEVPRELIPLKVTGETIVTTLPGNYNKVSKLHRKILGENYRKLWNTEVKLPVLYISKKGLKPTELGGGMQTRSLRFEDADKKEWVIRSIDKFPEALLPGTLSNTLAASVVKDNVTATFPYAPMTVAVMAQSAGVPHTDPQIMYVAPDPLFGTFKSKFANTIVLFEQREPLGKSTSTLKMIDKLKDDNDNAVDQAAFLKARMFDLLIGDWDRHADQWRWIDVEKGKNKLYSPVPRDRDQVYYINQGFLPGIFALPWIQPKFQGFDGRIKKVKFLSFNARYIDGIFTNQLNANDWTAIANKLVQDVNDTVIATAMKKIPSPSYEVFHKRLEEELHSRRNDLIKKVPVYYKFLNKIIDIPLSDKNEFVSITDSMPGMLNVNIYKISKEGEVKDLIYYRQLDPSVTKEIRIYLFDGNDSILINNKTAGIAVRIIGKDSSSKTYSINSTARVDVYEGKKNAVFNNDMQGAHLHLSNKKENTAFATAERYNKTIPLITGGYNADDGLLLGAGVIWIKQGFRRLPYASKNQITFLHAFSSNSFRFHYTGEWIHAIGKADLLMNTRINAPDNSQNFFGRGNETDFDKTGNYKRFYRSVFTIVQVDPALRWRNKTNKTSLAVGPSVQYYHFSGLDNAGRFINNVSLINSYDSSTIAADKMHAGVLLNFIHDTRNQLILPQSGIYLDLQLKGYDGLNKYSAAYGAFTGSIAMYKALDRNASVVIADRIGGGVTVGKSAFYQSMFLGGQENLLGYRQFRFAGRHMAYNNFEMRIKLANIASYIVPGQLGIVGLYDVGRVWEKNDNSDKWHQGVGGGIYFAPAQLAVFNFVFVNSPEGWYPYITMGFRF